MHEDIPIMCLALKRKQYNLTGDDPCFLALNPRNFIAV